MGRVTYLRVTAATDSGIAFHMPDGRVIACRCIGQPYSGQIARAVEELRDCDYSPNVDEATADTGYPKGA